MSDRLRLVLPTFGCKANQADTAGLMDAVAAEVGRPVDVVSGHHAGGVDLVIVNTCTVTHTADADARQAIRRYKRENPAAQIVVTGCYAQTDRAALEAMPEVDLVVGNIHKSALPAMMGRLWRGEAPERAFVREGHRDWNPSLRDAAAIRTLQQGQSRPFVKVQDGCNYVCSFCIIPKARGVSRSVPMDEVVATIERYVGLGAREVVLTGIHLGHWGRDLSPKRDFASMVEELLARTRVARLRISSLEPNEVSRRITALAATHPRVCPHLHVPLQSGSDRILGAMQRVYRTPLYRQIAARFGDAAPGGAWGIDVMVGFPGETDEEFQETYRFLRAMSFTYLHVFPYSPRRGTPAATMMGQVDPRVKRQRVTALTALSAERRIGHARRAVGHTGTVLVEERRVKGRLRGFTEGYVPVLLDGPDAWFGELVPVAMTDAEGINAVGRAL